MLWYSRGPSSLFLGEEWSVGDDTLGRTRGGLVVMMMSSEQVLRLDLLNFWILFMFDTYDETQIPEWKFLVKHKMKH